jgi:hypothetical protein
VGARRAGLGGPQGAHQGAGALPWPNQAVWDSPTLPGWQGWLPLGAYIRRGTPSLLIHQLIPDFSLDLVVPKLEPRRARGVGDLLHHSPLPRCWCSGPSLPLLVLDWSFGGVVSTVRVRLPARCCASGTRRPASSTRP